MQILQNHVPPAVSSGRAAPMGPLPSDQNINFSIVLPLRNENELTNLLGRLYDRSSPDYHHFLTVEQFTNEFSPTTDEYQAVVAFAQANGFTVTGTHANRMVVPVAGSVAQVNRAFNVAMRLYRHPTEDRLFYAPDREPTLNLGVRVGHISGLNNFSLPHPAVKMALQGGPVANVTGSGPGGSYLGSDMRAAYYGGTTLTGAGQAVGLLEFGGYNLSDVNSTFSNAGQTYSVPINNVLLDGETGAPSGDDAEQVLDIVQAIGMAPGLSQVRVYIGSSTVLDDPKILSAMASENIAKQISCSWTWSPDDPTTDDVFFREFAAQGQSFFSSSGDDGAFDAAISATFYPAEDAYVTSIGGTHLTTTGAGGAWVSESAWNSSGSGSGGGISPDGISIPSWQFGVANTSNGGSATLRNVPDLSMEGDFDNYYCNLGSCGGGAAGTSFAAPRWAGFMALVNQQAVEAGTAPSGGIGFINPAIYSIAEGSSYGNDLHDVSSGNNDTDSQPVWFNAVQGYDLVTGWGSANGQSLINALAGPQVPGFWIESASSSLSVSRSGSTSTTITVTDAGGFTGAVTLAVTSALPSGVTASWSTNPTTGSSVLKLTASSSAVAATGATLTLTGTSGSLSATTNLSLTVVAPSFSLSASPTTASVAQGGSGTTTITVTSQPGFSGSVSLAVTSGLPSGVTASWSANPTSGSSVLTLTASATAAVQTSTLTITGTSGGASATTTLSLAVYAPSFNLSSAPNEVGLNQGSSIKSTIYVTPFGGFSRTVFLNALGLPSGVTASLTPNPTTGSSTLTLTASSTATPGTTTLTITGLSAPQSASTTLVLDVRAAPATTSTTLALTSGGTAVTTVAAGSVVTLTAAVSAGSKQLTSGQVNFCDAAYAYCSDVHLLGTAQLTSAGTAVLRFFPGMGRHSYQAVYAGTESLSFAGTAGNGASSSNKVALTVTATNTSTTTIAESGVSGNYMLTATVTGQGLLSPSGSVSFQDTSSANSVVGSATLVSGAASLTWQALQSPVAGTNLNRIATADFNGDGIPDLAVVNSGVNSVTILLGKGDGSFTASSASPTTGSTPDAIATGDFNGDGIPDLAVANANGASVTVLLGKGDGTFTLSATPATGNYPDSIAVGDFNQDGIPDLAVANLFGGSVTILLGSGTGTFSVAGNGNLVSNPNGISTGDFNGDGIPDLAVANSASSSVTILLGNGDGTFAAVSVNPPTGSDPYSIAIGDFNGDGVKDLAVTSLVGNTVSILLGNGNGTFAAAASLITGNDPIAVATGDFNADGKADLVVSNYNGNSGTLLLGNGDGTFMSGTTVPTGNTPWGIAVAAFNRNGSPGVAVANAGGSTVTVLTTLLTQTGTATASGISPVGHGAHLIDASYSGDSYYAGGVSATASLTAQPATATVAVTPSSSSITTAQALTVTVVVSGANGNPTPTGSVTLTGGGYTSAATALTNGSAAIVVPAGSLATGVDALTVSYTPTPTGPYASAVGTSSVTVTLAALAVASIKVTGAAPGAGTATITVSFNGFTETVRYDSTSTMSSIASAFAVMFSRDDLKSGLCASASGNLISFKLKTGVFQAVSITGSSSSFQLAPAGFP